MMVVRTLLVVLPVNGVQIVRTLLRNLVHWLVVGSTRERMLHIGIAVRGPTVEAITWREVHFFYTTSGKLLRLLLPLGYLLAVVVALVGGASFERPISGSVSVVALAGPFQFRALRTEVGFVLGSTVEGKVRVFIFYSGLVFLSRAHWVARVVFAVCRVDVIVMAILRRTCILTEGTFLLWFRPNMQRMLVEILAIGGIGGHGHVQFCMGTVVLVAGAYLAYALVMEELGMHHFGHELHLLSKL